ncbi:energy transducer TonB [Flavobacterium sp. H122]|uniref:energy transducer TonB n=1 Tax=Flavobacterium sp. H122 TaxID=2529860 RepID=UPI0010A9DB74|nr:energy transducer TonB [Flavobacterium sp. H122]
MKHIFLLVLTLSCFVCSSQIMGEDEVYLKGDLIQPKFNGGGLESFRDYIYRRIDKTKIKQAGKVVFTFDIIDTGEIKNIRIAEFKDMEFAMEVIRVLKQAPKWQVASRGGKSVTMNLRFPVEFVFR